MLTRSGHHHPEETRWFMIGDSCIRFHSRRCGSSESGSEQTPTKSQVVTVPVSACDRGCSLQLSAIVGRTISYKQSLSVSLSRCPIVAPSLSPCSCPRRHRRRTDDGTSGRHAWSLYFSRVVSRLPLLVSSVHLLSQSVLCLCPAPRPRLPQPRGVVQTPTPQSATSHALNPHRRL